METREQALDRLRRGGEPRVLIVGGGINGVGVLRDLSAQGIAATLIDKGDLGSGTSAAPSRLIHGGLRYLETGEFALVRESVEERDRLLRNAPHLVRPIRVWVPAMSWGGGVLQAGLRFLGLLKDPGPKGAAILKLGLVIFDGFSRGLRSMPRHRLIRSAQAAAQVTGLSPEVKVVAEYYDARITHPERLVLELAADAERDCPAALALPYVSLQGMDGGEVVLRDEIGGDTIRCRPSLVVNCGGAWADIVDRRLGIEMELIGGTRGSHLVLDRPDLARQLDGTMLYFETPDHRACLIYALDDSNVLLGTTDLRTDDPDDRHCTEEEIDYLFDALGRVLPEARPTRDDIAFVYAGVRPLPIARSGAAGAISRDHALHMFEPDAKRPFVVATLIGGKWTTYRACAAQIADAVLARLSAERRRDTAELGIGGGKDFPTDGDEIDRLAASLGRRWGLPGKRAADLVARYGGAADEVAAFLNGHGDTPLRNAGTYSRQEIEWILRNERVGRLEDVVLRRTLLAFENFASADTVIEIGEIAGSVLGWSSARLAEEIEGTLVRLSGTHRVPRAGQARPDEAPRIAASS